MKRKDEVSQVVAIIQNNPSQNKKPTPTVTTTDGQVITLSNNSEYEKNLVDKQDIQEVESGYRY